MSANTRKRVLKGMGDLLAVWIHRQEAFQEFHCFCCANTINLKDTTKSDISRWKEHASTFAPRATSAWDGNITKVPWNTRLEYYTGR
jgi:hypothetical protein